MFRILNPKIFSLLSTNLESIFSHLFLLKYLFIKNFLNGRVIFTQKTQFFIFIIAPIFIPDILRVKGRRTLNIILIDLREADFEIIG